MTGKETALDIVGMNWGGVNIFGWIALGIVLIVFVIYAVRFFKKKKEEEEKNS